MSTPEAATYRVTETPRIPAVYAVLITLHGVQHPMPHEPTLYAYWDGVDQWSTWEFSIFAARRASMCNKSVRYPWRCVEVPDELA